MPKRNTYENTPGESDLCSSPTTISNTSRITHGGPHMNKYKTISGNEWYSEQSQKMAAIERKRCPDILVPGLVRNPGVDLSVRDKMAVVSRRSNRMSPDCAYILDVGEGSIKFGVTHTPKIRIRQLQRNNPDHTVTPLFIYRFPPGMATKAELECKKILTCGTSSLRDGPTETTYSQNLESVRKIYESHGGQIIHL